MVHPDVRRGLMRLKAGLLLYLTPLFHNFMMRDWWDGHHPVSVFLFC